MLLVDTNIWLEAVDQGGAHHDRCRRLLADRAGELAATAAVVAETGWVILDRLGSVAQTRFLRLITGGQLTVVELTTGDWERVVDLVTMYAELRLDVIDASIVAVAERLGLTEIATMNARDFTVVRPAHTATFTLVPDDIARY